LPTIFMGLATKERFGRLASAFGTGIVYLRKNDSMA